MKVIKKFKPLFRIYLEWINIHYSKLKKMEGRKGNKIKENKGKETNFHLPFVC